MTRSAAKSLNGSMREVFDAAANQVRLAGDLEKEGYGGLDWLGGLGTPDPE